MKVSWKLLVLSAALISSQAQAVDLASPFTLETTKVLPKGIRNPRFINVFTGVDNKFSGVGQSEPLGTPLFKTVTWSQVMLTQVDDGKRATVQGLILANGLQNDSPGNTTGSVSTFANVKVPALAYGVTERFTLAVAVPLVNVDVSADTGFHSTPTGKAFVNAAADSSPALGLEAQQKMNNSVNEKLRWAGMQEIHDFTVSSVGDVQVVGKYLLGVWDHQVAVSSLALKETFILPTGTPPDPDRALDVPTGDGRLGVGTQLIFNEELGYGTTLVATAGYTAYMPHRITRRLPTSGTDPISQDKEELHENMRHLVSTNFGLEQKIEKYGLGFTAGYNAQYLSQVSYEPGLLAQGERMAWLRNLLPSETLHSILVSAGFSTIDWYKAKKFFYPFEVKMAYAHPFAGRNATTNDLISAELVLFF